MYKGDGYHLDRENFRKIECMLDEFEVKHLKTWLDSRFSDKENKDAAYDTIINADPEDVREMIDRSYSWQRILDVLNFKERIF